MSNRKPFIESLVYHVRNLILNLEVYNARAAVVGGAAVSLYLNQLDDIRDIDIKVCIPDKDKDYHYHNVLDYIVAYINWIIHPMHDNNIPRYSRIEGPVLSPIIQQEDPGHETDNLGPLNSDKFNLLVLPNDVRGTQARIVLRGRWPIDQLPSGHYKYVEYIDIIIPHGPCRLQIHVVPETRINVLALHDLVREQIAMLESPEFKEGGRRFEERASKKKRIRALLPLLTEDLNNNNARRLSNEIRGTNV